MEAQWTRTMTCECVTAFHRKSCGLLHLSLASAREGERERDRDRVRERGLWHFNEFLALKPAVRQGTRSGGVSLFFNIWAKMVTGVYKYMYTACTILKVPVGRAGSERWRCQFLRQWRRRVLEPMYIYIYIYV